MQVFIVSVSGLGLLCLCGAVLFGQGQAARVEPHAPTDKSAAWSAAEVKAAGEQLAVKKETTHRFFKEKSYNGEVRRLAGPQPILLHGTKSDFMVIQEGEGTFVSGGKLVNGKPGGEDPGDLRGDSIQGGDSRVLKAGDVMFVPAGIPHGFINTKDHVTFVMVRFDTK